MRSASLLLLSVLTFASSAGYASPVYYTINFSPAGDRIEGSFDYDAATSTFTNFFVVFDGFVMNLTATANAGPDYANSSPAVCGFPSGGAGTFALLSGSTSCPDSAWFAESGAKYEFQSPDTIIEFGVQPNALAYGADLSGYNPSGAKEYGSGGGTFSLTPTPAIFTPASTPEPPTSLLLASGLLALLLTRQKWSTSKI